MNSLEWEINSAATWLLEQVSQISFGEAIVKIVMHGERLVRTERTVTNKMQPGNVSEIDSSANKQSHSSFDPEFVQNRYLNMNHNPKQPVVFICLEPNRDPQILPVARDYSQSELLRELKNRAKRMIHFDSGEVRG